MPCRNGCGREAVGRKLGFCSNDCIDEFYCFSECDTEEVEDTEKASE